MSELKNELIKNVPREIAGSRSSNCLDYQKDYAIYCLIELHQQKKDYRILFDYYDDIVILFPSDDPRDMHFYQVKTTSKANWTLKDLLKKKKNSKELSILSKLFFNFKLFPKYARRIYFVSNAKFKFKLSEEACFQQIFKKEFGPKEIEGIKRSICQDIGLEINDDIIGMTYFIVSPLNRDNHTETILGKLSLFLADRYKQEDLPSQALLRTLRDYINRKQNQEKIPKDFDDLCKKKSLSSQEFEEMLNNIVFKKYFTSIWTSIQTSLNNEQYSYGEIQSLKDRCCKYLMMRLNPEDEVLQQARKSVRKYLLETKDKKTLREIIINAKKCLKNVLQDICKTQDEKYFEAMIIIEDSNE